MKNYFKWKNYLLFYAALLLVFNIILIFLPLTNVFGYEFSALNSIIISFLSGIYIIASLKSEENSHRPGIFYLIKNFSLLLLIPFLVSIINSLFTGFCSFTDGLLFYLVLTAPSIIVGASLGVMSISIAEKIKWLIFILLFLFVLVIALFEIYFNPQVYLYNPVFGFFPGTIYDEGLSVNLKLFFYRLLNSIFFAAILFWFHHSIKRKHSRGKIFTKVTISIFVALFFYIILSPLWGYTTTFSRLKNELALKIETDHFITFADRTVSQQELNFIALNQEYFYKKLSEVSDEEFDQKINSFIFKSSLQKKELFGSGNADVAKPWQNTVYVSFDGWENTLEHEIAHCFAGKFGWGIFKVAADFNPALIEGVAEACDGFYDEMNIHFLAAIAFKNNFKLSITDLFSGYSFFGNVSGLSYIYSGSFIRYLIEKYGFEKVKQYYRSNEFAQTYEQSLTDIEKEYFLFLNALSQDTLRAKANYYFGRQSIIQKVCPRYISDRLTDAWNFLNKNKFDEAKSDFDEVLGKTNNYSALIGLSIVYEKTGFLKRAVDILEDKIEIFTNTSYEYNLKFRIADLKVQSGELNEARKLYEYLKTTKPSVRLDLLARLRLELIKEAKISDYVSGSDYDKYFLIKELNKIKYSYSSIPIMIDLSKSLNENYEIFISNFENNIEVNDFYSSYAALKLSQYMLENFDFLNAKKLAGLALRFKDDEGLFKLKKENFNKTEWFSRNAERILGGLTVN